MNMKQIEKEQAKRLPINWRSNKEVVALVRSAIKNAEEETSNVFLPEQGKNKHEIEVLKIELKRVSKLYNSALLSVPVSTDLEIEVRVREETTQKIEQEIKDEIIRKQKAGYSTPKLFNNKVQRVVYLEGFEDGLVFIEKFFKKRFLVKSEVQKE